MRESAHAQTRSAVSVPSSHDTSRARIRACAVRARDVCFSRADNNSRRAPGSLKFFETPRPSPHLARWTTRDSARCRKFFDNTPRQIFAVTVVAVVVVDVIVVMVVVSSSSSSSTSLVVARRRLQYCACARVFRSNDV